MTAEHLIPVRSDRGFARLPAIPGESGGSVRVYESSAAMGPHIWLSMAVPEWTSGYPGDPAVHLTVEDALKLSDQLRYLVEHHYQGTAP